MFYVSSVAGNGYLYAGSFHARALRRCGNSKRALSLPPSLTLSLSLCCAAVDIIARRRRQYFTGDAQSSSPRDVRLLVPMLSVCVCVSDIPNIFHRSDCALEESQVIRNDESAGLLYRWFAKNERQTDSWFSAAKSAGGTLSRLCGEMRDQERKGENVVLEIKE